MFNVAIDSYFLNVHRGPLPDMYGEYIRHSRLSDEFSLKDADGEACLVTAGYGNDWPLLVVAQRFKPFVAGFNPGVLLVPQTKVLFIGAGERLLAYTLDGPARLWQDTTDIGFWGWSRHGNVVLMSAETELAAWDITGQKLWTTFVEPPWNFTVEDEELRLDVMGKQSSFSIADGPSLLGR